MLTRSKGSSRPSAEMPGLDQWRRLWVRLGAAAANGLLFHDLIGRYSEAHRRYHTTRHLDGRLGALNHACGRSPGPVGGRVHALVLVTAHDAVPRDIDERVIVDVDLSILGAGAERFDECEAQARMNLERSLKRLGG